MDVPTAIALKSPHHRIPLACSDFEIAYVVLGCESFVALMLSPRDSSVRAGWSTRRIGSGAEVYADHVTVIAFPLLDPFNPARPAYPCAGPPTA
jgi:hypothetical protein